MVEFSQVPGGLKRRSALERVCKRIALGVGCIFGLGLVVGLYRNATATPGERARWAREAAKQEAKRKEEQLAEEREERRSQGYVTAADYPGQPWPWKTAREVQLQCHGRKSDPQVTIKMPDGFEYGLNGVAMEAGWTPIDQTLPKARFGIVAASPPSGMIEQGIALCPDELDKSIYEKCFSPVFGTPKALDALVSQQLRDPDSFEAIETRLAVPNARGEMDFITKYRARNGFGGMSMGTVTGTVRLSDCAITSSSFSE